VDPLSSVRNGSGSERAEDIAVTAMPRFHVRARPRADEVSVAIHSEGTTATVLPPDDASGLHDIRDLRLANALHYASALAGQLGTDVGVLDDSDTVFFIEDQETGLVV
jgi:hypothetical protein